MRQDGALAETRLDETRNFRHDAHQEMHLRETKVRLKTNTGFAVRALAMMAALVLPFASASAGSTWDGLKPEVFGTRSIASGIGIVSIKAPFRPEDQRAVPVSIDARFPDGRTVKSVTLVVDENPSPVAAVFNMGVARANVGLKLNIRLNQETHVRAVVEASDGALYMAQQLVRFAGGQAACSAPPTGNPEEIAANMGKMKLANVPLDGNASSIAHRVRLAISHPNHTGMALDQQTLLYIPLKMVASIGVSQGATKLFDMAGSITLSENPQLEFDVDMTREHKVGATLKDSDGAEWSRELELPAGS